jgi:hypothetical protein
VRRTDGRIVERVRLPLDLVDAVAIEADRRGVDFDTCAGDLVAEALPQALAEAAKAVLRTNDAPGNVRGIVDDLDSTPLVELNSTARRITEGACGGPAT